MYYLKGNLVTNGEIYQDKYLEVTDGKISYIGSEIKDESYPVYEVQEGFICPGLIDIHIHAVSGHDFMDDPPVFKEITEVLPYYGVTSVLATSRTGSLESIMCFLASAQEYMKTSASGTQVLGVHLEGPWISAKYKGAQAESYIRNLDWDDVKNVIDPYKEIISLITLAPEELAGDIINYLKDQHITVSAGHTAATLEEIDESITHGLSSTTHTFNAMSPIHHRTPGTASAALLYDELACEVIADGLHVHPKVIELLYKVKGKEKMILISDCTGYDHLSDGQYDVRGKSIVKKGNKVTLTDGTLAGSTITLNEAIKYIVKQCGISLEEAIYMATQTPLKALGLNKLKKGQLKVGYDADVIVLTKELNIKTTVINGEIVYNV